MSTPSMQLFESLMSPCCSIYSSGDLIEDSKIKLMNRVTDENLGPDI